jgi:NADPH-dependent 2,4-dienoyl-CoA reductase/sulfur reductase-like enzyme/rhodanese-related sulfurtransferase
VVEATEASTGKKRSFSYDNLVLATGAFPLVPPLPGKDLSNIFTLTTIEDALAIQHATSTGKTDKAVIVGGGLIGMEAAEALADLGLKVTVVEMMDWILPALIDKEMGLLLAKHLRSKGVEILTGEKVVEFRGDSESRVREVVTQSGTIEAQLVLLAIGVRPNVALARGAGVDLGRTGGIKVNEFLETSDPHIYAGGDCVENRHILLGKPILAPMGSTANKHGRVIANNLSGDRETFDGVLGTVIFKAFDYAVGRTGLSKKEATEQGYQIETAICPGPDRAHFYPGHAPIVIKLVADKRTGKLLGTQILGPGDIAKRLDIMVTALTFGAAAEQVSKLDLAYAPPYSPAMDNLITACNVMRNKLEGRSRAIDPLEVKDMLDRHEDFILLNVRTPKEIDQIRLEAPNVMSIPLGKLRERLKDIPRNKEVVPFCKISLRGYEAALILESEGFKEVRFMDGGILAWPYDTVSGRKQ